MDDSDFVPALSLGAPASGSAMSAVPPPPTEIVLSSATSGIVAGGVAGSPSSSATPKVGPWKAKSAGPRSVHLFLRPFVFKR